MMEVPPPPPPSGDEWPCWPAAAEAAVWPLAPTSRCLSSFRRDFLKLPFLFFGVGAEAAAAAAYQRLT